MPVLESRTSYDAEEQGTETLKYPQAECEALLHQGRDSSSDTETNAGHSSLLKATTRFGFFKRYQRASYRPSPSCTLRWARRLAYMLLFFFAMIGVIESISLLCGIAVSFFSEDFFHRWGADNNLVDWPTDLTRGVLPAPCHSHNDYSRPMPLFSALKAGCVGVEADVWLVNDELHVAHTRPKVSRNRTLHFLYIDPLLGLLEEQNSGENQPLHGVFETDPSQSVVLLIDFKTNGAETLPYVMSHLSPLRDRGYLTHWNGSEVIERPVTVVATGNAPFDLLTANSEYRDIFYDAPLDLMEDGESKPLRRASSVRREDGGQGHSGTPSAADPDTFNRSNSYYASVSYERSIGFPWHLYITSNQLSRIRAQINGAHRRGLKVRYWATPSWPRSLRNHVWSVLVREGADMLNVDDLKSATTDDWRD